MIVLNYQQAIQYLSRVESCLNKASVGGVTEDITARVHLAGLMKAERLFLESRARLPTELVITDAGFPSSATLQADIKVIWEQGPQIEEIVKKALSFEPVQDADSAILPYSLVKLFFEGEEGTFSKEREATEKGLIGAKRLGRIETVEIGVRFKWGFFEDERNKLFCLKRSPDSPEVQEQTWAFRYFEAGEPYALRFELDGHAKKPIVGGVKKVYGDKEIREVIEGMQEKFPSVSDLFYKMPLNTHLGAVSCLVDYKGFVDDLKTKENLPFKEAQQKIASLNELGGRLRSAFDGDSSLKELFQEFLNQNV